MCTTFAWRLSSCCLAAVWLLSGYTMCFTTYVCCTLHACIVLYCTIVFILCTTYLCTLHVIWSLSNRCCLSNNLCSQSYHGCPKCNWVATRVSHLKKEYYLGTARLASDLHLKQTLINRGVGCIDEEAQQGAAPEGFTSYQLGKCGLQATKVRLSLCVARFLVCLVPANISWSEERGPRA